MNSDKITTAVEKLIDRSAQSDKSEDAMRYSQAACNAANALCSLKSAETIRLKE